jgi:hypothetical protein
MLIVNGRRRFTFPEPFFSSNRKQHKPQTTKTTQTTNIKMQLQPFFFYHTKKLYTHIPSKIKLSGINPPPAYAQNF